MSTYTDIDMALDMAPDPNGHVLLRKTLKHIWTKKLLLKTQKL